MRQIITRDVDTVTFLAKLSFEQTPIIVSITAYVPFFSVCVLHLILHESFGALAAFSSILASLEIHHAVLPRDQRDRHIYTHKMPASYHLTFEYRRTLLLSGPVVKGNEGNVSPMLQSAAAAPTYRH